MRREFLSLRDIEIQRGVSFYRLPIELHLLTLNVCNEGT